MARINIEEEWWSDPRRIKLSKLLNSPELADGVTIAFWRAAQEYWKKGKRPIPHDIFNILEAAPKLLEAKLAISEADGVYAVSSEKAFEWIYNYTQAASAGGKKSAETRRKKYGSAQPKPSKRPRSDSEGTSKVSEPSYSYSYSSSLSSSSSLSPSGSSSVASPEEFTPPPPGGGDVPKISSSGSRKKTEPVTAKAWAAYSKAFEERYNTPPLRNLTVNSQLASFVKRVGEDLAPEVIAFYVRHRSAFYSQKMHPVGLALADAEKLSAEYRSGRMLTRAAANREESIAANADLAAQIMREE